MENHEFIKIKDYTKRGVVIRYIKRSHIVGFSIIPNHIRDGAYRITIHLDAKKSYATYEYTFGDFDHYVHAEHVIKELLLPENIYETVCVYDDFYDTKEYTEYRKVEKERLSALE